MDGWTTVAQTTSVAQTQDVAAVLGHIVAPGDVVTLDGDLGAGKTHFTQGLALGLGVVRSVTSPTFALMEVYDEGRLPLYHFDLYRLEDSLQLEDIGFYEYVEGPGVSCVEWASRFPEELPEDHLEVRIEVIGERKRRLCARGCGYAATLLGSWQAALEQRA